MILLKKVILHTSSVQCLNVGTTCNHHILLMRDPSLVPMLLTGAKYLLKIDGSHRCHFLQLIKDASDVNDIQRRHLPQILPIQLSAVFKRLRRRTDLPVSSDL